ncbi:hypothetical protein BC826DRAFT_1100608 [Russula brevipes]|nr:hypothetical protein BC826DRAFT_1100608 [Russula brevipes]
MTRLVTIVVLVVSVCTAVLSADLSGFVQWNEHCADSLQLGHAKVVLDNSIASGTVTRDGGFLIPDVAEGTYILSVLSRDHVFDKLRVDVPPEPDSPPEIRPYTVGTPLNPPSPIKLPHPIKLVPRERKSYFVPHQSFDVVQMFQNPMMLITVFGGLMMLAMPYIMKNMDPEVLQEAQQNQARLRNALQSGDPKSGLPPLAGSGETRSAVTTATSSQGGPNNAVKNRAKKRRG